MQSFDLSIQVNLFELSNYISQLTQQNEVSASSFFLFLKLLMIKAKFLRKCYCFHHSHKKRKDSLESRTVFLIFSLELKISGVAVQSVHQNSDKWRLLWGIAWWKWLEAVLAIFCCYDHGAKASEAVQKIATDQKEYRKCSLCVIICWIAKIYLSINNSEKWLVTGIPPT